MSGSLLPTSQGAAFAGLPGDGGAALCSHLDRLAEEKEKLGRELLRSHEQLNLVFEITGHITNPHEPDLIQAALLRRYGAMLGAGAVFMDRAGCCMRLELDEAAGKRTELSTQRIRGVLAAHVEAVRRDQRMLIPPLTEEEVARLDGARVLLGTLARADTEMGVVIALRDASEPPFDDGDVRASESVLTYGAQVLSNVSMVRHLQRTALETVCTLVNAIDAKDNYTSAHSERVAGFARLTGEACGLPKAKLQTLEWAGLLHDVGKIGVPEQILNKPGALTSAELEQMRRHARTGYEVLKPVGQFEPVLDVVLYHHENYDGSGYPEGLRGEQIPIDARIIHVVDIFDALTTTRPYRHRYSIEQSVRLLEQGAGRATDPNLTRLFIDTLHRYMAEQPDGFRARFGHLTDDSAGVATQASALCRHEMKGGTAVPPV